MLGPDLLPGVEQFYDRSRLRIDPSQIAAFVKIAIRAREAKVLQVRIATMLAWNDMLDMERNERRLTLTTLTILTTIAGSLKYA